MAVTPSATDITATSDGTNPTPLASILDPLAGNGGPTLTHALPPGSPAIDLAPTGPATDQRGEPRPGGAAFDAGAYELQLPDDDADGIENAVEDGAPNGGDGNNDGTLFQTYRYALDAADLDFLAVSEHNGAGGPDIDYINWLLQQACDVFMLPRRFTPIYGYERSVSFPNGHRNILFATRGTPTLPVQSASSSAGPLPICCGPVRTR